MCNRENTSKGFTAWCNFCSFVTDDPSEEEEHIKKEPDHITNHTEFIYSINNKPNFKEPEKRTVQKYLFVCMNCEKVLIMEERVGHVLKNHLVVMVTTSFQVGKPTEFSEDEKREMK